MPSSEWAPTASRATFPETEGDWDSDSWGAYVDVETDITDRWTVGAALRYEDYDEFDDTTDWKVSSRYDFTDTFALRATANTGFRAPSPGQVNTLNVTTSADAEGNLIPNGTYPVDNPVAQVLGSKPLENEESTSYTVGSGLDTRRSLGSDRRLLQHPDR